MRNFHRPEDEKRMVVILPPDYFDDWLSAKPEQSARFLIPYPAQQLWVANRTSEH
jgi:putative SOS response-associated peptidase YedK